jgi:acylphosphatase
MQTISIIVSGKVQGVWFRQSTKEKAIDLGITGEVKNLPDGRVLIIATGTKELLDKLLNWCRVGPEKARVMEIEVRDMDLKQFDGFLIIRHL